MTFAALCAAFISTAAGAAELTIAVDGVASNDGQIMVAVYDSADGFPARPVRAASAPARSGAMRLKIADLPAGDYAFAIYHDANGNNRLDRNAVGMPTEDFAFSNNALGERGAPRFEDARVTLPAEGAVASVNLR
ncbi:DUF2141 domain-containing protein [Duganella callida]|uniref:DUF2141 domain-containing protein n=1 Tax=Duganella callida TaxID=2561932 RepID=A0A4Y9S0K5_9BURK|nr:DUF2141 domain-containing protein [Duganella callida]